MNWDTREISLVIENNSVYSKVLEKRLDNELSFLTVLFVAINDYNEKHDNSRKIDSSKVNGNQVYVRFCEIWGKETEGWK